MQKIKMLGIATLGFLMVSCNEGNSTTTQQTNLQWYKADTATNNNLNVIRTTTTGFIVVGESGTILTSNDGVAWKSVVSGTTANLKSYKAQGTTAIIVGDHGTILESTDLTSWQTISSGTTAILRDVKVFDNIFIAVGDSGTILTSSDGLNWSAQSSGTNETLTKVRFFNNTFIILGDNGTLLTSTDGTSWSKVSINTIYNLTNIAQYNNTYIITSASPTVFMSTDLTHWDNGTSTGIAGASFDDIAVQPTGVSLFGENGVIAYSTTLTMWQQIAGITNYSFRDAPNKLSVIGAASNPASDPTQFPSLYMGVGSQYSIVSSSDGVTWNQQSLANLFSAESGAFKSVLYKNHRYIVVGDKGAIAYSGI